MYNTVMNDYSQKQLIVFDMDDTLTETKSKIDQEMLNLLYKLLKKKKVAIISGAKYEQIENQILKSLNCQEKDLENLYIFPTCATSFYAYKNGWVNIYTEKIGEEDKEKIMLAFSRAFKQARFVPPKKLHGKLIEDRGSQITFSALGQFAPVEQKKKWDSDKRKRIKIRKFLLEYIPHLEVLVAGTTSIDVTKKGIDKGYGIKQMEKYLNIPKDKMLFFGDALEEGENDYPVKQAGVDCVAASGPEDTKKFFRQIITW